MVFTDLIAEFGFLLQAFPAKWVAINGPFILVICSPYPLGLGGLNGLGDSVGHQLVAYCSTCSFSDFGWYLSLQGLISIRGLLVELGELPFPPERESIVLSNTAKLSVAV